MIPMWVISSADYRYRLPPDVVCITDQWGERDLQQTAARKSELHANTPAIAHTDLSAALS